MKIRGLLFAGIGALTVLVAILAWWLMRPQLFVRQWVKEFSRCQTIGDVRRLPQAGVLVVREFSDKTWCAARSEHSCGDGAGFDATVFHDSKHRTYSILGHHYCGNEGLKEELSGIPAKSSDEFLAAIGKVTIESLR